jgi:nitrilase
MKLGDLRADTIEHVAAECSFLSGDDRRAEFCDHRHGAAIVGTPKPAARAYARQVAEFRTVRVAAVQATPVILDAKATVKKATDLIGEAAADGAELVVLPETFVPLYPSEGWAKAAADFEGFDELWERLWTNSVEVPGPLVDQLAGACAEHGVHLAIGVNERESERPGTIYNALLLIGPEGLLAKHRKLMPTHHEKLFHGIGAGGDLDAVDTPLGRIGGLICWENRMPLARYAVYRTGPQIWVAPTADDSDSWLATVRHIAIESGAYVVSVPQFIPRSAFPEDFPAELPEHEILGRGGAAIIEPTDGELIAGPLYDKEGIVTADCDLRTGLHAKRWFDSVGHYSREDVLLGEIEPGPGESAAATDQDGSSSNSRSPTSTSSPGSKPAR